jgi:hypothetical protein
MGWECSAYGEGIGVCSVFVGKPEGKRPLGRPRCRWEDNMELQEVGCGGMVRIELAQDRDRQRKLVNAIMSLQGVGDFLTSCKPVSFSRGTLPHGASK